MPTIPPVDPGYITAAIELVSRVGLDVGKRIARVGWRQRREHAFARGELVVDPRLRAAIDLTGRRLAGLVQDVEGVDSRALRDFLEGPEAAQIVRQLFVLDVARPGDLPASAKQQFILALALKMGVSPEGLEPHGAYIFDAFATAIHRALELAGDFEKSDSSQARAQILRHYQVAEQLASINKNIALLSGQPDREAILDFDRRYREQVLQREGQLRPPSFDRGTPYPLETLYVEPDFLCDDDVHGEQIPYGEFAARLWRAVILGNPGGGKSSLCARLCTDVIARQTHFSDSLFPRTPILVPLREYYVAKQRIVGGLLAFIETKAASKYQLPWVPPNAFDYLLRNGYAFFIFDGLDEILDVYDRREVVGDVESLLNQYPFIPALLLSRRSVYGEAPLGAEGFETYGLTGFGDRQVAAYARKWFSLQYPEDADERSSTAESFLEETRSVPDLRSNPLMLGLMANIYTGPGSIPYNRPAVLDKCATMLFEVWDSRHGLRPKLSFRPRNSARTGQEFSFELDLRKLLEYLANWIYNNASLQEGVREGQLVSIAADYLVPRVYELEGEGTAAARELVSLCRGRTWVFSESGKADDGDLLYAFAHQTFLEYFAASHLVATNPTPSGLFTALWPRIKRGEGDQMVQLAIHLEAARVDGAADAVIGSLLTNAPVHREDSTRVLALTARLLGILTLTPACVRRAARHILVHAASLPTARRDETLLKPLAESGMALRYVLSECEAVFGEASACNTGRNQADLPSVARHVLELQRGG